MAKIKENNESPIRGKVTKVTYKRGASRVKKEKEKRKTKRKKEGISNQSISENQVNL